MPARSEPADPFPWPTSAADYVARISAPQRQQRKVTVPLDSSLASPAANVDPQPHVILIDIVLHDLICFIEVSNNALEARKGYN